MDPKIATCCYCGARAALVMDKSRHELVCSSCGAPLHNLKRMRSDAVEGHPYSASHAASGPARPATHPHGAVDHRKPPKGDSSRKRKKSKKRKSLGRKIFKEAFDLIEDIFD